MEAIQDHREPLYGRFDEALLLHPFRPHEAAAMLLDLSPAARPLLRPAAGRGYAFDVRSSPVWGLRTKEGHATGTGGIARGHGWPGPSLPGGDPLMSVRVDHGVTSGTFTLDGETFDVDNNVWVIGDDTECIVIDAPHSVDGILAVTADRKVKAIVCTHAHDDHVRVAPALRAVTGAPVLLHPDDRPLWELTHGGPGDASAVRWDADLADGQTLTVDGISLRVLHTPGHAPGAVCLYGPGLRCVFTGDTLFHGGPGATGRSYSDRPTLEASIRARLFTLPEDTIVHPGHGQDTTIGAEKALLG
jgi:glyoxylase-like metal-dependent hydrolase (beta-lactamase superfamily II)